MIACPKCAAQFNGPSFGPHAQKCGLTIDDLFWVRVDKNGAGGCWNWTASRKPKGYGQFLWKNKMHRAHRLAWTLSGLELPAKGLELAHRCDNRICVNPEHLFVATHAANMADCKAKGRQTHGEKNPHAKLNPEKVREIRRDYTGDNAEELARKYGVGPTTIYVAATRRTWKTVQ